MLEFRILGPLEVWDGENAVELSGQRQRSVLALLAIHGTEFDRDFEPVSGRFAAAVTGH